MKMFTKFTTFSLVILCLFSCSKSENYETPAPSFLSFVNASPTPGTYNFYLAQTKINSAALPFGSVIPHFSLNAGTYTAKLTTANSTESVISKEISLTPGTISSLFLVDKGANLNYLVVEDKIVQDAEKSFIRLINLSPDAAALDLVKENGDTVVTNKIYKAASEFREIAPAAYVFKIKTHAGDAVNVALPSATIVKGKHYTIISKGMVSPEGTDIAITGQLITH